MAGIVFLILGVITLIALLLPGEGRLTDWWRNAVSPWFGAGRRLLPVVLIGIGLYIPRRVADGRWVAGTLAILVSFVAFVGLIGLVDPSKAGRIGKALADVMPRLVTGPGTAAILLIVCVGSLLFAFNRPAQWLIDHGLRLGRSVIPTRADVAESPTRSRSAEPRPDATPPRSNGRVPLEGVQTELPTPTPSSVPMSGTVWAGPARDDAGPGRPATATAVAAVLGAEVADPIQAKVGIVAYEMGPGDQTEALHGVAWELPTVDLLSIAPPPTVSREVDHRTNKEIIVGKLRSFGIEAHVAAVNSGPVVTQYEVVPEANVKLSRIEGLADDLAMALAARSIRIEAPIPGKNAVGIEIPNVKSETVDFRSLVDETQMLAATSRLTFALGRDVSGKGYAVDLAKMPHLLVAGATGSGKSVCVNALITSILMHARPHEVRFVLIDLKRVELAPYDGLPHLLQHVIVEPFEAKAALNWAVHEMEERYKALASHTVRNIGAYNEKVDPDDRLPYVILVIDELADLIMREGRKVEDPVVKIAQKARAVGIHLVLATQRPSVNVVTGLIKANVPSRIAFAMASMVDSRTVLDQPGAEDLIGRGDMLYQPVDLPRPVRMQGVFVSDKEVSAVVDTWKGQTGGRTFYDESLFAFVDGEDGGNGGQFAWLAAMAEDDMVVQAAELVTRTGRASTSNLQTKLKVGFSRASRLMDELERYGIIGPQDPRNPATPRIVYGPDNWLRSHDDIDDPGD